MEYTEIKVSISTENTERAGAIANMVVPYGIYIEDYSDLEQEAWEIAHIDLIDEELLLKDRSKSIIHIYVEDDKNPDEAVSFLKERLENENIGYDIEISGCSDSDWRDKWKTYFKPTPVGDRLFIRPIWIDDYNPGDRAVLNIEPGAAFGTGTHDTTRLCLETLDKVVKKGDTVLDIGCGSGILAISSLLLGAGEAFGVDIDELAVKTAKANGKMNGFDEPELRFVCGDLADKVTKQYDIVVANIVADIIILFSTQVRAFMKKGAKFIASGIIDTRADEVVDALCKAGLVLKERIECDGWVCLVCE